MSADPRRSHLSDVNRVILTSQILAQTTEVLRTYGRRGCEGFLLWTGTITGHEAAVSSVLVPPQESIKSEDGVGYFITTDTLFAVNKYLSEKQQRLIAQVHSHPSAAYHSETDDRYAIVTTDGGFSLVVPDFARQPMTLLSSAIYRLNSSEWCRMTPLQVRMMFQIKDSA